MRIHIACVSNERYAPQAAAMLHSVLASNRATEISVHYVHDGDLSAQSQTRLRGMIELAGSEIDFLTIDPALAEGLPVLKQLPAVMWYRVFLPSLLPSLPRVLYLDCDTLVEDSLQPLWECDLEGNCIAAVTASFPDSLQYWPAKIGLPGLRSYFSSGVLLLDLNAMRESDAQEKVLSYGRQQGNLLHWPDQDALNAVLHTRRLHLHPRWNFTNNIVRRFGTDRTFPDAEILEAQRTPAIIHFDGQNIGKPWQHGCRHPHRHLYFHHLRQTPWSHEIPARSSRERLRACARLAQSWVSRQLGFPRRSLSPVKSAQPAP